MALGPLHVLLPKLRQTVTSSGTFVTAKQTVFAFPRSVHIKIL